ncbi:hypothetical protein D3C71_2159970 [compost metagenome]
MVIQAQGIAFELLAEALHVMHVEFGGPRRDGTTKARRDHPAASQTNWWRYHMGYALPMIEDAEMEFQ